MIRIIAAIDSKEVGKVAADVVTEVLKSKKNAVLGLATGSSPVEMYKELIRRCDAGEISFKNVKTVNLDEYVGLSPEHDQSYAYFMSDNLFDHVDIDKKNTNLPSGLAPDPEAECRRYDAVVDSMGGVDLQVLGIGNNGHIGFNEPSDHFVAATHLETLDPSTIEANSRFFASKEEVPTSAITMGMKSIMQAKSIVLVASGKKKEEILMRAFEGDVTPAVPASILQLHPNVTVILSE